MGRMGLFREKETEVDPLVGLKHWEIADALGMPLHDGDPECTCRPSLVKAVRHIEREYDQEEARGWLRKRLRGLMDHKKLSEIRPAARDSSNLTDSDRNAMGLDALRAADCLAPILLPNAGLPLEAKVTVVGSIAASLSAMAARRGAKVEDFTEEAVIAADGFEPLHPFLGDDEWLELQPPATLYLTEAGKTTDDLRQIIADAINCLAGLGRITPQDGLRGLMFHLDRQFRNGIRVMACATPIDPTVFKVYYVPATHVGSPRKLN